jgi:YD repeat-containing protein
MKAHVRPTVIAALLAMLSLGLCQGSVLAQTTGIVAPSDATLARTTISATLLTEPLVPAGPTSAAEDQALAQALGSHRLGLQPQELSSLTGFLARNPNSGWAPALLTNLGYGYLHDGYFSKAIDAWQKAWRQGKSATTPEARALVDRAVGELAMLYASLGKMAELAALVSEIGNRPIVGSATELIQVARETLTVAARDPRHLFLCGPHALQSLMLRQGAAPESAAFLQWYQAGPNGTTLAEVAGLADKAKFQYRLIYRKAAQPVPASGIVHMKVGHFATIVAEVDGRFHVQDPALAGRTLVMTPQALDSEASGYFLVPAGLPDRPGWRRVDAAEAAKISGKGNTSGTMPGGVSSDIPVNGKPPGCGSPMCAYDIKESTVSVTLSDTPVGYVPPIGPSAKVVITYNQREDSQPANFSFYNIGQKWTLNWLSFVTDDPVNVGINISRYIGGGGSYSYSGYSSSTGRFTAQTDDGSVLVRISGTPIVYQRWLKDGSIEVYSRSDGAVTSPRRIFLTQIIDPQGNALTLNYDSLLRLTSVTDAAGRQTTFTYGFTPRPLQISQITDPFGRSATLTYSGSGNVASITDVIGLTSSFGYDANLLLNSLITPYGTTTFAYTAPGTAAPPRFVQATDPLGFNEREDWLEPAPVPATDPAATVPTGMPGGVTNNYLQYRNSYHWDKNAYVVAGCTPTGGCDYTKARSRHFAHWAANNAMKSTALESEKYPLENRIWYNMLGQTAPYLSGTFSQPSAIGRVLDDGTTQLRLFSYDTTGYFNLTKVIDPLGRTTNFVYPNQIDLAAITRPRPMPLSRRSPNSPTTISIGRFPRRMLRGRRLISPTIP